MDRRGFLRVSAAAGATGLMSGLVEACSGSSSPAPPRTPGASSSVRPRPRSSLSRPGLRALGRQLHGDLLRPGDNGYATGRLLYDPRFDGVHPRAIAMCADADDVRTCLDYARQAAMPFAVRAGGHSYAGYSTSRGLVIDLTRLDRVKPHADGTATLGPGALLGDVYAGLASAGRAIASGSCATVGFGGIATAGGIGIVARDFGLTVDSLRSADVALSDGRLVTCSDGSASDLFFAVRGAGASVGIVTRFVVQTHPAPTMTLATLHWPWSDAQRVVAGWQSALSAAPRSLWSTCHLTGAGGSTAAVLVHVTSTAGTTPLDEWTDRLAAAVGAAPTRSVQTRDWLDTALLEAGCGGRTVSECHLPWQTEDGVLGRQRMRAASAVIQRRLPASTAGGLVHAVGTGSGSGGGVAILLDSLGGAVADVAPSATAFPHRQAAFTAQVVASYGSASAPADAAARSWVAGVRRTFAPVSVGGYLGYVDPDQPAWAQAYWGANLARLQQVCRTYDAARLFVGDQRVPH